MLLIVGTLTVIICVLGSYAAMGGSLMVLWQPFEYVIILGAGVGAYLISNPMTVLKETMHGLKMAFRGPRYNKESYLELLGLLYSIFKLARSKGLLQLEQHVEHPEESALFKQFPSVASDEHAMTFLCDYLRMLTLGTDDALQLEQLMDAEIETHEHESGRIHHAIQAMADGMPALGIVAAVLGVIKTMGSITEPPEVLGQMIGGALVGTFFGVWMSYGFIAPLGAAIKSTHESEGRYLHCIKAGLLAHVQGNAPSVSIEFARKALMHEVRPTFYEVEQSISALVVN